MPDDRLDGWKDISQYMGRDIRTCQRWEKDLGLPVYRMDVKSDRSKVYAFQSEIETWLKERRRLGQDLGRWMRIRKTRFVFWLGLALVVVAGIYYVSLDITHKNTSLNRSYMANPVELRVKQKELVFYDAMGNFLWRVPVDNQDNLVEYYEDSTAEDAQFVRQFSFTRNRVDFADIDGDGKNEVLASIHHRNSRDRKVALYDNTGDMIWEKSVEYDREHVEGRIVNEYFVNKLSIEDVDGDGEKDILVLWSHVSRYPSVFYIYDLEGNERLKYEHPGILQNYIIRKCSGLTKCIFLVGTNNLCGGDAVLAVLDPLRLKSGLAPPYSVDPELAANPYWQKYTPLDPDRAFQKYYIRFHRNAVRNALNSLWHFSYGVHTDGTILDVMVNFGEPGSILYYQFDADFRLKSVYPGTDFSRLYTSLFNDGQINIPLDRFLIQCKKDVLYWDGFGWAASPTALPFPPPQ